MTGCLFSCPYLFPFPLPFHFLSERAIVDSQGENSAIATQQLQALHKQCSNHKASPFYSYHLCMVEKVSCFTGCHRKNEFMPSRKCAEATMTCCE